MGARKHTRSTQRLRQEFRATCAAANEPCWICGTAIDYAAPFNEWRNPDRFQLDHFYPVSTHPHLQEDPTNFRASHAGCNEARGNGTVTAGLGTLSRQWV